MAFEELLQLLSKSEAVDAKQDEVMRLFMLATAETVASGDLTPGDPEWKAIAARAEALGLQLLAKAAGSVERFTRMAAEYAASPGGEAVAEAYRRLAASAVALAARAEEYVAFMRDVAVLADSDSESDSDGRPAARRSRRPNARYFGPEWTN
ncbi:hypothetical protein BDA96_07G016500 [Sorghum bicolor]|uniref:Uncharacterized protein n=1 Tax=Sorghum bicolor TaxID=4558 RepID=A0A921U944_SORBI|nr:hypothetical protein BDA96_07G016500 [Sorghum bicolor]